MTVTVPLQSVPSQSVSVVLNNQNCTIQVATRTTGLYCTLYVDSALIIASVICQDRNRIVRSLYLGFVGDLMFIDNQGQGEDPVYTGLGTRFSLAYLTPEELRGAG